MMMKVKSLVVVGDGGGPEHDGGDGGDGVEREVHGLPAPRADALDGGGAREGAAAQARTKLGETLQGLVTKGKLESAQAQAVLSRIEPITDLSQAQGARLVVEAIVEKLSRCKQTLERIKPGCTRPRMRKTKGK